MLKNTLESPSKKVSMVIELEKIVVAFSQQVKGNFADYVALYNSFIVYTKEKYYNYEYTLEEFLNHDLTRRDIIDACVYYVKNSSKVKSDAAITKYLNSLTKLYEDCFIKKGYNNRSLFAILPFGQLKQEVHEQLKDIKLNKKKSFEPITENNASKILQTMKEIDNDSVTVKRSIIIIKLAMLYGFKLKKLKYMTIEDVDIENRILKIQTESYKNIVISLELPYGIVSDLKEYFSLLNNESKLFPNQYLFLNDNNKIIDSSIIQSLFSMVKKEYENKDDIARLTMTGISKFAIINMIKNGLSKANIKLITGMEDMIVDDCERCFLEMQYQKTEDITILNREINKKIRGIETFDAINNLAF